VSKEPSLRNGSGIHRHTDRWEGFMKYVVEMGSGALIYIPSFIKIGSGIQKLFGGGGDSQTNREQGDLISLLYFFFFKLRKVG
jgi:hypothetical protein